MYIVREILFIRNKSTYDRCTWMRLFNESLEHIEKNKCPPHVLTKNKYKIKTVVFFLLPIYIRPKLTRAKFDISRNTECGLSKLNAYDTDTIYYYIEYTHM